MNIELKPIAEKKIEQMGGEVFGVVIRDKRGRFATVSEMGFVTWLDSEGSPEARAQGSQGAFPIGWVHSKHLKELEGGHPIRVYHQDTPVVFDSKVPVYTQPQPAVPEESRPLSVNRYGVDRDYFTKKLEIIIRDMRDYTPSELARSLGRLAITANSETMREPEFNIGDLIDQPKYRDSTPTTPQADGWVRCEDRLPEPRRQSRKTPNGILAKHESGRITQFRDVTETLLQYMRNGPRKPTKFEQPVSERITEWMDLDAERAGGKQ